MHNKNLGPKNDKDQRKDSTQNFSKGILRLQNFFENANRDIVTLEKKRDEAIEACKVWMHVKESILQNNFSNFQNIQIINIFYCVYLLYD